MPLRCRGNSMMQLNAQLPLRQLLSSLTAKLFEGLSEWERVMGETLLSLAKSTTAGLLY